jgi:hypothetical protein
VKTQRRLLVYGESPARPASRPVKTQRRLLVYGEPAEDHRPYMFGLGANHAMVSFLAPSSVPHSSPRHTAATHVWRCSSRLLPPLEVVLSAGRLRESNRPVRAEGMELGGSVFLSL